MKKKSSEPLHIDKEFKKLIYPLSENEYFQLETNLLVCGCRDPIITWNGFIIDGHNRYEICTRHQLTFYVDEIEFDCRDAAIVWICANQLGRRNLTEEARRFLIGTQCDAERSTNGLSSHIIAQRMAEENAISNGSVVRHKAYARALKKIGQKAPEIFPEILSGKCKMSHGTVVVLSQLAPDEIKRICYRIESSQQSPIQHSKTRKEVTSALTLEQVSPCKALTTPSVKDMPVFDPDAEIAGITLTIPSWISSIARARRSSKVNLSSGYAKSKLAEGLRKLQHEAQNMLAVIEEA